MSDGHPIQQWPRIPVVTRSVPQILVGDPESLVRLELQTYEVLTVPDDEGVYRTVVSPHPDSSHLVISLSDFRQLAAEIEDLALDL